MPCATPNACMRVFSAARTMCLCASPRLDEESRIFLSLEYPLGASERSAASKRAPPCHSFARRRMTHPAGGENFRSHPGSTEESRPPLDDGHHGLGPFFGSLPPDVLRELLLPKLDVLSRVLFARAAGACWRAMKDSGLSCRVEKGVVCSLAASGGHLECLRCVREQHGCPWDAVTCAQAAWQGHLECLRYAHEHGCPWDAVTCAWAARGRGTDWTRTSTAAPGKLTRAARAVRTSTAAPGMLTRALMLRGKGTWSVCGTRTSTAAPGKLSRALGLRGRGTWSVCGTRTSTAAPGKLSRALGLRGKGTWSVCGTRETTAARVRRSTATCER